jgi:Flp pilus assembly protein TadD
LDEQQELDGLPASPRPLTGRAALWARAGASEWSKDVAEGVITTTGLAALGLVGLHLGLMSEARELKFELFAPYEFWQSFRGLVIEWSQWNQWLLLGLGLFFLGITSVILLRLWRAPAGHVAEKSPRSGRLSVVGSFFRGAKAVGALVMLAALFLGAFGYQQYLWKVALPVPDEQIGIAFTRQMGSSVAQAQLADFLRQMGHEGQIAMRELPVTFDARNIEEARALARRINADAVVVYREEGGAGAPGVAARLPGLAAPAQQVEVGPRYVAYIVFADPMLGTELPVPARDAGGRATSVEYREKGSIETPRLEASDLGRLMEATAGILLYDQDRYLPGIAHLRNALQKEGGTDASDATLYFFLGNGHYLIDQEPEAAVAFDRAIELLEAQQRLALQDRLVLARAYTHRASLHFYKGDYDRAERLLRQAVALREPLDRDQSALADPVTARRVHETFGSVYISLLQLARYRGDEEAATLWTERAQADARALLERSDDRYARDAGIWMSYRVGQCEDAYRLAQEELARDPDNLYAHRLLWKIAGMRDGLVHSVERDQHVQAILESHPESLIELQAQLTTYALHMGVTDSGYMEQLRATADRILQLDPHNAQALEQVVSSQVIYGGLGFIPGSASMIAPVGHARTYDYLASQRARDARKIGAFLEQVTAIRPYATRWAEEVQPGALAPLVQRARLSGSAEHWLYNYLYSVERDGEQAPLPDRELAAQYLPVWERAVQDAQRALEAEREGTAYERIQAHQLMVELWGHRYHTTYESEPDAATEAAAEGLRHGQEAARLLEAEPEPDTAMIWAGYYSLVQAAITARVDAAQRGDGALEAEYSSLVNSAFARLLEAGSQGQAETAQAEAYLTRESCAGSEVRQEARQAVAEGNPARAVELLERYRESYPQDPGGILDLGWYQYLAGDLDGALATTESFETLAPAHPFGPGNRAIILLAQGRAGEARQALARVWDLLAATEPVGLQLQYLISTGNDLAALARDNRDTRPGLREAIPAMEGYVDALSPAASERGSLLVVGLNNLGAAAFWAEEYETARRLYERGLAINPDYILLRANLALARLAVGDTDGASQAYNEAIASATRYMEDAQGNPLEGDALVAGRAAAHAELQAAIAGLEAYLVQQSAASDDAERFLSLLREAAEENR